MQIFFYLIRYKALHVYCMNKHEMKTICIHVQCIYIYVISIHLSVSFRKQYNVLLFILRKLKKKKRKYNAKYYFNVVFLTNLIVTISLLLDPCFKKLNFKSFTVIPFSFRVRFLIIELLNIETKIIDYVSFNVSKFFYKYT